MDIYIMVHYTTMTLEKRRSSVRSLVGEILQTAKAKYFRTSKESEIRTPRIGHPKTFTIQGDARRKLNSF